MQVVKRNGTVVDFDISKIMLAIEKANKEVEGNERLSVKEIQVISNNVADSIVTDSIPVEAVQDRVENELIDADAKALAKAYIKYRYRRALVRKTNTTDEHILSLIECENEEVKEENSNKNPTVVSVQRDYMAGEVSKDVTRRFLLDEDIAEAFSTTTRSLENWRKQAVLDGPLSILHRQKRVSEKSLIIDGEKEAKLTQIACSKPINGKSRWSLRMLADRLVELEIMDSVSHETVRRTKAVASFQRGAVGRALQRGAVGRARNI